ncbi:MAG: DMT family transporter [Lentisphaerae bacterium]|nr:DMT family transporter [Lentisphaerota bacterium]
MIKKIWGSTAMIIATILWGVAFSAQSRGMDYLHPMLFTALRSAVGVGALCIVIMVIDFFREKRITFWGTAATSAEKKELLTGGVWCGVVLAVASVLQQYGVKYTSAGKTGFLTALYIVIVPVLGIFLRKKTTWLLWLAVALALSGAYLLCGGIDSVNKGEWFVIGCAFIYSLHILVIDRYAPKCDSVRLSCVQFVVAAILTFFGALVMQEPCSRELISSSMPFWIFCGVGSSAAAFTLQIVAQKYLHPVTATLLMSLESVFAVLGGWIFLHEILSPRELLGCFVIFVSVIISQIPLPEKKRQTENG